MKKLSIRSNGDESTFTPVFKLLPSIVTLSALFLSMTAMRFAMHDKWVLSVAFVVAACILDGVDGRLARMLNASSDIGEQLDSLADCVNFGIVPPVIVYLWQGHNLDIKGLSWGVTLLFAACMMLRLARFNVALETDNKNSPLVKYFFTGVPAPMGAGLLVLPMILLFEFGADYPILETYLANPLYITIYVGIVALMLVSTIPTIKVNKIKVSKDHINLFLASTSIIVIGLIVKPWLVLTIVGVLYICFMPIAVFLYSRTKKSLQK